MDEILNLIKIFFQNLLANTGTAEIFVRTLCVLFISEGARITFRMFAHSIIKMFGMANAKRKRIVQGLSESFGILITIGVSLAAAFAYVNDKAQYTVIYEGVAYGFACVFIHYIWAKYELTGKVFGGMRIGIKKMWNAFVARVSRKK